MYVGSESFGTVFRLVVRLEDAGGRRLMVNVNNKEEINIDPLNIF